MVGGNEGQLIISKLGLTPKVGLTMMSGGKSDPVMGGLAADQNSSSSGLGPKITTSYTLFESGKEQLKFKMGPSLSASLIWYKKEKGPLLAEVLEFAEQPKPGDKYVDIVSTGTWEVMQDPKKASGLGSIIMPAWNAGIESSNGYLGLNLCVGAGAAITDEVKFDVALGAEITVLTIVELGFYRHFNNPMGNNEFTASLKLPL